MRLLFVCARNRLRSPTAERVLAAVPGVEVESAGVAPDAENPVTPELIAWGDVILVMEAAHRAKLNSLFSAALRSKRVVCASTYPTTTTTWTPNSCDSYGIASAGPSQH